MATLAAYTVEASLEATDAATVRLTETASRFLGEIGLIGFELAASEALTNIVRHSYGGSCAGTIGVTLETSPEDLTLTLSDEGRAAPPGLFERPAALDRVDHPVPREDGWGIGLLHQCAQSVRYRREAEFNVLVLTFQTQN
ncbi:ATP-binding protein [Fulvimarina sp. MAC3]|uniref:ATP-binding protein n=1 Tax=Fulvimarina sp. MAC3 TaxID=3148887 RepID=UPI0031FBC49B